MPRKALEGIRIMDLTQVAIGPYTTPLGIEILDANKSIDTAGLPKAQLISTIAKSLGVPVTPNRERTK